MVIVFVYAGRFLISSFALCNIFRDCEWLAASLMLYYL